MNLSNPSLGHWVYVSYPGDSLLEVDASQNRLDTFPDLGPRSQLRTLWLGGNQARKGR